MMLLVKVLLENTDFLDDTGVTASFSLLMLRSGLSAHSLGEEGGEGGQAAHGPLKEHGGGWRSRGREQHAGKGRPANQALECFPSQPMGWKRGRGARRAGGRPLSACPEKQATTGRELRRQAGVTGGGGEGERLRLGSGKGSRSFPGAEAGNFLWRLNQCIISLEACKIQLRGLLVCMDREAKLSVARSAYRPVYNGEQHELTYDVNISLCINRDSDDSAEKCCSGKRMEALPKSALSVNVSELKLSEESLPYLSSSLDADIEMYDKKRTTICCAQVEESKKEADMLRRACDNTHFSCGACDDCRQSHLGEDSQLEYLSAHEQDLDGRNSPSEFPEQRETIGIETLKLIDPVCEVPGGGPAKEQNLLDLSEDCSPASECGIGDQTCPEAALPELSHLLQDSLSLTDCSGVSCDDREEQTEYHSAVCGSVLESHSCGSQERVCPKLLVCDTSEDGEVEDVPLIDGTPPPQTAPSEEVSENNERDIHSSISVNLEDPLLSPRERAPAVVMQFCKCAGDSDFYSCEEAGVSCVGCAAKSAETQFPVLTRENPFCEVGVADKSSLGNSSSLNSEMEHRENLKNVTSDSTVKQAFVARSDFRACSTTSRSASARVCLSRAVNTEITMMNKSRPVGWHREACADVACNTDWSYGAGSTEETGKQFTDTLEKHSASSTATAERSSQIQEQRSSKNELCSSDVKIITDSYCQQLLKRAIAAELQILNTHYEMCYQHCLKIYKLALEENTCFSRYNGSTELRSSLLLVLEELKKNYSIMREKIKTGIPLSALPPLSVEIKLFPISSSYVPCKDNPQTVCLTDGGQPRDSTSSKTSEEQRCVENEEEDEYWFNAKEELTVADFSVVSEETEKQGEKEDAVNLREAEIMESENECSFIRVGGLCSSVSEGDLRSHFQKYQISDVLICVDSHNYRYAFLCFKETNKAKLAVEEMNQKKIKGKPISVELVNNSAENKSLVSQVLTNKLRYEIQPVDNSQTSDQDKTLTSPSNSVKAPDATSASEKMHLLPITSSKLSCSTRVPSETKCTGLKSSTEESVHFLVQVNQKNTRENTLQKTSAPSSTNSLDAFISPNTLNLSSFTKLLKKLQEIHPEASRDKIVDALLEVRKNNKGILSGLSISSIVERTSVILRNSAPSCGLEKQFNLVESVVIHIVGKGDT
ncbi:RNA-binding protein 44 [Chlamydotis macqueenii]